MKRTSKCVTDNKFDIKWTEQMEMDWMAHKVISQKHSQRTISSLKSQTNKNETKKKCFQVSSFHTLCILMRRQTCSDVKRSENVKTLERTLESGGLGGVKLKFVIPQVQVDIKKMLQLVRRFCQQDRLRGKTPVVCYVRLGNGRSACSWVMQCISPQHCDFISSSLSLSIHLCEARVSVGSPSCSVSYD